MPITMEQLPLSKVYQLLEPRPVVPLTTARKGLANVMTMSWHMMVNFKSPLVACVVSNANYSFAALRATGKCVLAIPAQVAGWGSVTSAVATILIVRPVSVASFRR